MQRTSHLKSLFCLGILLAMVFAVQLLPARAQDAASLTISFGLETTGTNTIGKSYPLSINIMAGANPVRGGSLQCFQNGTVLSASSISRLPNSVLIGANQAFKTEQYYRTVAAGTSSVYCVFNGTDTVTGLPFSVTSNTVSLTVSGEKRLNFSVQAASENFVSMGQDVYFNVVYSNRGTTTLTNINVVCSPGNRGFQLGLKQQNYTTLTPGQSGYAQFFAPHVLAGAYFTCGITAVDSSTGEVINLQSAPIRYTLR
jgi:hypothetical protein